MGVRRELSGGGGAADSHGHIECSGVNSSRPVREGREELNLPAGAVRPQDGEASGLDPEVLHGPENEFHILSDGCIRVFFIDISTKFTELSGWIITRSRTPERKVQPASTRELAECLGACPRGTSLSELRLLV